MRILIVSNTDGHGGAGRAAYRLHRGLLRQGVHSRMRVLYETSMLDTVDSGWLGVRFAGRVKRLVRSLIDSLPCRVYPRRRRTPWTVGWLPGGVPGAVREFRPDIVHLHWVADLVAVQDVSKFSPPIVWTLHDLGPVTGGCRIAGNCRRFEEQCGLCPQLGSHRERDLSRWTWTQKRRHWDGLDITVVTPSRWLAGEVRASSLFRDRPVHVVPNAVNINTFQPMEPAMAKAVWGLPQGCPVILYCAIGGVDSNGKGFADLKKTLRILCGEHPGLDPLLVVCGGSRSRPSDFPCPTLDVGYVQEPARMASLYSAADVFVLPTHADNLPNTLIESLSCGTPCVTTDVGGCPEIVEEGRTGHIVKAGDASALGQAIRRLVTRTPSDVAAMRAACRRRAVEGYSQRNQVRRMLFLYNEVLNRTRGRSGGKAAGAEGLAPP